MENVYKNCPVMENDQYILKLVTMKDAPDLLRVYGDEKSVPLFNSDNCHGDRFYYSTLDRMEDAIRFWISEYEKKRFVRWVIFVKEKKEAVGTIELFHRDSVDILKHYERIEENKCTMADWERHYRQDGLFHGIDGSIEIII